MICAMLPAALRDIVVADGGVVRRRRLVEAGLAHSTIRRQVARGDWRAYGRDVLIAAWAPEGFETSARAAMLSQPTLPATGLAAILHYPASPLRSLLDFADTPWLVADRGRSSSWRPVNHPTARPVVRDGRLVLLEEDALIDLVRLLPFDEAITAVWLAVQNGVTTADRLRAKAQPLLALQGRRQLREIVQVVEGGAKSSGESRLIRLLETDGLTGKPDVAVVVGERRFRIDYAFPQEKVGVEFDGYRFHSSPSASRWDRQRHNLLSNAGWDMRYFTWRDVVETPAIVVEQVREALARAVIRRSGA